MQSSMIDEDAVAELKERYETKDTDPTGSGGWVDITEQEARRHPLYGLGGWMILVIIGIFGSMFQPWAMVIQILGALGSKDYPSSYTILLVVEALVNITLAGLLFISFVFVVTKNRRFPELYFTILCAIPILIVVDSVATSLVLESLGYHSPVWDKETLTSVIREAGTLFIWGMYLKASLRVNVTFLHRVEEKDLHLVRNEAEAF